MTRTRVAALLTSTREVRSHHGEAWVGSAALEEGTPMRATRKPENTPYRVLGVRRAYVIAYCGGVIKQRLNDGTWWR
jgi:hypothetical protein